MATLLDFLCSLSIFGIYPRYIEPRLSQVTKHKYLTKHPSLHGLKIVQLSDLHIGKKSSPTFFKKVLQKVRDLQPDLILLTGDYIQNSRVDNPALLTTFLQGLQARYGCFAVLGNHDYDRYVGILPEKCYGIRKPLDPWTQLKNRLKRRARKPNGSFSPNLKGIEPHPELINIFNRCGITLLHNRQATPLPHLTLTGVGEYWAGDCDERSVAHTDNFSLLLLHNPDGFQLFQGKKVDLALSGHIHCGQVNLPIVRKLFLMSEGGYLSGFYEKLYVNRGLGGVLPLRFCAVPEITFFELYHA